MTTRLTVLVALLLVPLLAVVLTTFWQSIRERRDAEVENAVVAAKGLAEGVDAFTQDIESTTLALALAMGASRTPLTQEELGRYLTALVNQYAVLRTIFVTDLSGKVLASYEGAGIGTDISSRSYIQALQSGRDKVWSDGLKGLQTGEITVAFGRTIYSPEGTPRGFLVAAFYPDKLMERLPADLPGDARVVLLDATGFLLHTTAAPNLPLAERDVAGAPGVAEALNGQVTRVQGVETPRAGESRFGAYVKLGHTGWLLGYLRPQSVMDAAVQSAFVLQAMAITLLVAFATVMAALLARQVARPLTSLARVAEAVARGERPAVPAISADLEIEQLAEAMRIMGAAVQEREDALRTSESHYRLLFESNPHPMWVQEAESQRILAVNRAAVADYGYTREEFLEMELKELAAPQDAAAAEATATDPNVPISGLWGVRTKKGHRVDVEITSQTLVFDGRVAALVLATDVTERLQVEEALRFQRVLLESQSEASPDGILVRSNQGVVLSYNRRFIEMWDLSPELMSSRSYERVLRALADQVANAEDLIAHSRYLYDHIDEELREEVQLKDGRYFDRFSAPVRSADGMHYGRVWFYRDITGRKHAEDNAHFLAATGEAFAQSLDLDETVKSIARLAVPHLADWCAIDLQDGEDEPPRRVAVVHRDEAKLELANQLAKEYPPKLQDDRGLGKVLKTGQPEFYQEIPPELLKEAAEDEKHFRLLKSLGLKSAISVPLVGRGNILGAITLVTAESGRRYSEADLNLARELGNRAGLAIDNARLYKEVQTANEAKDEFLGVIAHELRSPLTVIYGGARLLRARGDRLDSETRNDLLGDLEQETERLYRLVEDLLLLARLDLGQQIALEPVSVSRVADKVLSSFLHVRPNRKVKLHIEEDLEPVAAESTYLEQVLRNLLSNADKYCPEDSPIEIRARSQDDEQVEVAVLDRGPGVDPEELDRIFERFYRSEKNPKGSRGLGIGLTACKRLVEAQNGKILAKTREGGGLEIAFNLQKYRAEL